MEVHAIDRLTETLLEKAAGIPGREDDDVIGPPRPQEFEKTGFARTVPAAARCRGGRRPPQIGNDLRRGEPGQVKDRRARDVADGADVVGGDRARASGPLLEPAPDAHLHVGDVLHLPRIPVHSPPGPPGGERHDDADRGAPEAPSRQTSRKGEEADAAGDDDRGDDRSDVALLVETGPAERCRDRHDGWQQKPNHPGQVRPGPPCQETPEPDRRQQKERAIVAQQRREERDEVEGRVRDDDSRHDVRPPLDEGRQDAVPADLRLKRAGKPQPGEDPVQQERGDGRARSTQCRPERPGLRERTHPEQRVRENEGRQEGQLGPGGPRGGRQTQRCTGPAVARGQDGSQDEGGRKTRLHPRQARPREGMGPDQQEAAQERRPAVMRDPRRQTIRDRRQGGRRREPGQVGGPRERQAGGGRHGEEQGPEGRAGRGRRFSGIEGEPPALRQGPGEAGVDPGVVERQAGLAGGAPAGQKIQRADEQDRDGDRGGAFHAIASRIRIRASMGGWVLNRADESIP